MSSGRPDFHPTMLLEGKYATSLIPVLVDALGQLFMIVTGLYAGAPKTLALDVDGRILAHLIGYDPAGAIYRTVSLDPNGNLIALMKGLDGVTLRTIAVDASGVMKANLSAQSFDFLRVRPVYGESQMADSGYITIHDGVWTSVFSATGRGAILGGHVSMVGGAAMANMNIRIQVEGVTLASHRYDEMDGLQLYNDPQLPVSLLEYDPVSPYGIIRIGSNLTFETSVDVSSYQSSGTDKLVRGVIYYSLVPTP